VTYDCTMILDHTCPSCGAHSVRNSKIIPFVCSFFAKMLCFIQSFCGSSLIHCQFVI